MEENFKYHIPEDIPANERTAFHGAAAAAAKAGKKNFNFAGKTHPVTMKKDTAKAIADQKESIKNEDMGEFSRDIKLMGDKKLKHHATTGEKNKVFSHNKIKKEYERRKSASARRTAIFGKDTTPSGKAGPSYESVKKESTMSFREKLMSLYESDKAKHYKSATEAEPLDNNLKGAGAKKMKADIQGNAADPDLEKKSHDDAAKAGRAGPSMKARSNDNKKGDKKIINPPTDETKKGQGPKVATESYGVSGNKVSNSLLDAIAKVENESKK